MIFVFVMLLSAGFMLLAYSEFLQNRKYGIWLLCSIMCLVIPAAIRGINVGTDVKTYQYPILKKAFYSEGFLPFYNNVKRINSDFLYLILEYICGKYFKSINMLFLIEEVLVLTPIYYVIWRLKTKINPVYTLIAYECLFYLETYNVIRQHLAISFLVLAFYFYTEEKDIRKFIIYGAVSFGMHASAIIGVFFPLLYTIPQIESKKKRRIILFIFVACIAILSFSYMPVLKFILSKLRFLPTRYSGKRYLQINTPDFPFMDLLITIIGTVLLVLSKINDKNDKRIDWLILANLIVISSCYFTMMTEFGGRITWYFEIYNIFSFGYGVYLFKNDMVNRLAYFSLVFLSLSFYWVYVFLISGSAGVFPYEIAILVN